MTDAADVRLTKKRLCASALNQAVHDPSLLQHGKPARPVGNIEVQPFAISRRRPIIVHRDVARDNSCRETPDRVTCVCVRPMP